MKMLRCENCNAELKLSGLGNVIRCEYCSTEHVLENSVRSFVVQYDPNPFRIFLREMIVKYFSLDDLRIVCENLEAKTRQFNYEDIPGETRSRKSLELVLYGQRRGMLEELIAELMIYNRPFALAIDSYGG